MNTQYRFLYIFSVGFLILNRQEDVSYFTGHIKHTLKLAVILKHKISYIFKISYAFKNQIHQKLINSNLP